jgi:hypothetical protein
VEQRFSAAQKLLIESGFSPLRYCTHAAQALKRGDILLTANAGLKPSSTQIGKPEI